MRFVNPGVVSGGRLEFCGSAWGFTAPTTFFAGGVIFFWPGSGPGFLSGCEGFAGSSVRAVRIAIEGAAASTAKEISVTRLRMTTSRHGSLVGRLLTRPFRYLHLPIRTAKLDKVPGIFW